MRLIRHRTRQRGLKIVKKRTSKQKSEDESKGVLQRLLHEWIVNPLDNDFGFDFEVRITKPLKDGEQEVTGDSFYIQNKIVIWYKTDIIFFMDNI